MDTAKLKALMSKKSADISANRGDREKPVGFQDGANRIRILPGWRPEEAELFFHDYAQHFIKGTDGKMKAVYLCVEKTYGRPCAVCDAIANVQSSSTDDNIIKALKASKAGAKILVNALMRDSKTPNKPVVLALPNTAFQAIFHLTEEWGNIFDLNEGRDIIVTRTGTGLNTEYTVQPTRDATTVPASVMGQLTNLDEYVAQENTTQERRALSAVAQVAGILPAGAEVTGIERRPSAPALTHTRAPAVLEDGVVVDEMDAALVELEKAPAPAAAAPAAKPAPTAAAAPAAATVDAELDDLLADL